MLAVVPVGQLMSSHLVPFNNNNALIYALLVELCLTMEAISHFFLIHLPHCEIILLLSINIIFLMPGKKKKRAIWNALPPPPLPRHCANQHNMNYCYHYSGWLRNNSGS